VKQVELDLLQVGAMKPREVALSFGRWLLANLDSQRAMTHILEREGDRFPSMRDRFRKSADTGIGAVAALIQVWSTRSAGNIDPGAVAALLVGGIVNYRRSAWTLGAPPLGLDDTRFLDGVASLIEIVFERGNPFSVAPEI
jgi:hypothetical protein